jgi:hypothetical protein
MRIDMKKRSPFAGAWAWWLGPPEPGNTPTATATFSHPQAMDGLPALAAALAICGVLGGVSLLVPPFIHWDSANGFLAWRSTLLGAGDSVIIGPDHSNIAHDTTYFLTFVSPGQYLLPGAVSLLGMPLGIAITLTVALSLLVSLIGWVMVVRVFAPRTSLAILVAVLIGSFHYSTHAFSTYYGGEILLQAITPWLVLASYRVPEMEVVPAALLVACAVFCAFLAKLTGLIVVAAALLAWALINLAFRRRITRGMVGGASGALAALAIIYVTFLYRGGTAVSETNWSLPFDSIAFAALDPWVAGMSWSDPIGLIYFYLTRVNLTPTAYLVIVLPPALLVAGLVLFWRPQTINEKKFRLFCLWFYGLMAAVFIVLFIHGAALAVDEHHFRSAGTLLLVCALMSAFTAGTPRWARSLFLVFCAVMALYGLASFSYHELMTAKGRTLDRTSWTNQSVFDTAAIDFLREAYARERRDALFVLSSYQLAVTLPVDARIIVIDPDYETESTITTRRYSGRVPGHAFVLIPNGISDTSKGRALLSALSDYPSNGWQRKTFLNMIVYFQ